MSLLPRETDALLEWDDAELAMLQGSGHAARARQRIALVDAVYREVFPALTEADPALFGAAGEGGGGSGDGAAGTETGRDGDDPRARPSSSEGRGGWREARLGLQNIQTKYSYVGGRRRLRRRGDDASCAATKAAQAAARFTSIEAFRWAFATVLARAFELPDIAGACGGGGGEMGLCPGLDLFNHG